MLGNGQTGTADKYDIVQACRLAFLKDLGTVARSVGVTERTAIEAFQEGSGTYFDEMVAGTRRAGFEESEGLTASRITLVGEGELELEIQLGDMARRLAESQGDPLRKVYLRFVTLLNRPNMATGENPVGIDSIVQGLNAMLPTLEQSTEKSAALLDPLESVLNEQLPQILENLCNILDQNNVKPALAKIQSSSTGTKSAQTPAQSSSSPHSPPAAAADANNPLFALQNAMMARQMPQGMVGNSANIGAPFGLAGPVGDPSAAAMGGGMGYGATLSPVTMEMLNNLFARMETLESQGQTATTSDPGALMPPSALGLVVPKSTELGVPMTAKEAAAIDTMALIFSAIFDDATLPGVIKSSIGSLQITILKVAMLDNSFFTLSTHPARLMLDRIAKAALGLPLDVDQDHPVCTGVSGIANRLRTSFKSDISVFEAAIAELDVLIETHQQKIYATASSYIPLLQEQAAHQHAASHAQAAAETAAEALIDEQTPGEIASFVRSDWLRVLQATILAHGENSPQWQDAHEVIRTLLWSIRPMQSPEERRQLAGSVPKMLKQLNAGFDLIGTPQEQREHFLNICFDMQTAALRGTPVVAPAEKQEADSDTLKFSASGMSAARPAGRPQLLEIKADGLLLKTWGLETTNLESTTAVSLETGDWLEFILPGQQQLCGLLCRIDPDNSGVLFYNPSWDFAVITSSAILSEQLRDEDARIISAKSLFDTAVAKALQQT